MTDKTTKAIVSGIALTAVFGVTAFMDGCYNSNQHDRKVLAAFRGKIFENHRQPQDMIKVVVDGVTREGPLNKGAAILKSGESVDHTTAFIVAADPQSECWYSNLKVTDGQKSLPTWEKVFDSELDETYFMNSAFDPEHYNCAPVAVTPIPGK